MAREARPYMKPGSSIMTMTYYGAEKVVPHYNVMGVAKAALEASTRYLAADLGPSGIRVNAISAGPVRTLSAHGIAGFKMMYGAFAEVAPLRSHITIEDVAGTAVYLASPLSGQTTGEVDLRGRRLQHPGAARRGVGGGGVAGRGLGLGGARTSGRSVGRARQLEAHQAPDGKRQRDHDQDCRQGQLRSSARVGRPPP